MKKIVYIIARICGRKAMTEAGIYFTCNRFLMSGWYGVGVKLLRCAADRGDFAAVAWLMAISRIDDCTTEILS